MKKQISLLALLLGVMLLLSSCGGLPTEADELVNKMIDEGYASQQTVGDENISSYVEEYGLTREDVSAIVHAQKTNQGEVQLTMGTFLFCKDESTAITLKSAIEASLQEQFGAINNPHYRNMTVEQKGNVTFFGTKKIWEVAND